MSDEKIDCEEWETLIEEPPPSDRGKSALAWYGFFVWMTPTVLMVVFVLSLAKADTVFRLSSTVAWLLFIVLALAGCVGCGWFAAALKRASNPARKIDQTAYIVTFCLLQIVIVPAVLFMVALGACAVMSI